MTQSGLSDLPRPSSIIWERVFRISSFDPPGTLSLEMDRAVIYFPPQSNHSFKLMASGKSRFMKSWLEEIVPMELPLKSLTFLLQLGSSRNRTFLAVSDLVADLTIMKKKEITAIYNDTDLYSLTPLADLNNDIKLTTKQNQLASVFPLLEIKLKVVEKHSVC